MKGYVKILIVFGIISAVVTSMQLKELGRTLSKDKEPPKNEVSETIVLEGDTKEIVNQLYSFSNNYNDGNIVGLLNCMVNSYSSATEGGGILIEEVSQIFDINIPDFFNIFKISSNLISDEDIISFYIKNVEIKEDRAVSTVTMHYNCYNGLIIIDSPMYFLLREENEEWRIIGMCTEEENPTITQEVYLFLEEGILY